MGMKNLNKFELGCSALKKSELDLADIDPMRLRLILAYRKMSARALALELGVSNVSVVRWVNGESRPSYIAVYAMANILEVEPAFFSTGVFVGKELEARTNH